eukprot:78833-Pelagomonas_calceolata.AAC.3
MPQHPGHPIHRKFCTEGKRSNMWEISSPKACGPPLLFCSFWSMCNRIATTNASGQVEEWAADAVVLAVGVKALQGIVQKSPLLASIPTFAGACLMNLGIIDAIAVRLWLDRRIVPESPSNVLAGFESAGIERLDFIKAFFLRLGIVTILHAIMEH